MRFFLGLFAAAAWAFQAAPSPTVQDLTHFSQVLGSTRTYRVLLPPSYAGTPKRLPVIYWFYGYEKPSEERDRQLAAWVAAHNVIVVKLGPADTTGEFPLYFPELVDHIDRTLRTAADRGHRGVTGFALGGFMALWTAAKFPDLAGSASSIMGPTQAAAGPDGLELEYHLDDVYGNYAGVRTLLATAPGDPSAFYHRRLDSIWLFARSEHESDASGDVAKVLDFHVRAFADPLPKPAAFTHADVYPNFSIWGWEAVSNRRSPGYTVLENVCREGFRSEVREWIPGGAVIPGIRLTVESAPLYPPSSAHSVTYIRLRDGKMRRAVQRADAQGRLSFDLDGEPTEVGISSGPLLAISGYEIAGAAWATAGQPVELRVKFVNKGSARSLASTIHWESPNPGLKFDAPAGKLFGLAPGESATIPVRFTVADAQRAIARIVAADGADRMEFEVPLYPPAESTAEFQIADGRTVNVYQHAMQRADQSFGQGNGDGHAAPGESFAVLLPDGDGLRAAEVITNDACVDSTMRGSDSWDEYDRAGGSAGYSLPAIRPDCQPGHVVHMLARIVIPNAPEHRVKYVQLQFPVWWRQGEEPKP